MHSKIKEMNELIKQLEELNARIKQVRRDRSRLIEQHLIYSELGIEQIA